MLGSLIVHHMPARSPSSSATRWTKGTKARGVSREDHPPLRTNHSGLVKWWGVTTGRMRCSRRSASKLREWRWPGQAGGVAHEPHRLAWMPARKDSHHARDPSGHGFDRLVAGHDSPPRLVDQPE